MKHVFFGRPARDGDDFITLDEGEARHLRVLRLVPGQQALVLDGRGSIYRCKVGTVKKHGAILRIEERDCVEKPQARAALALAHSKATRRGFFLEKSVELGADGIWIWQGERSQGRIPANFAESVRGQLIAGAKQCVNPWLPEVEVFGNIGSMLRRAAQADFKILPWELSRGPAAGPGTFGRSGLSVYVIGPEGGFSEAELAELDGAAFERISLGARILRCETAATLCLGLHWWASQLPVADHARYGQ